MPGFSPGIASLSSGGGDYWNGAKFRMDGQARRSLDADQRHRRGGGLPAQARRSRGRRALDAEGKYRTAQGSQRRTEGSENRIQGDRGDVEKGRGAGSADRSPDEV